MLAPLMEHENWRAPGSDGRLIGLLSQSYPAHNRRPPSQYLHFQHEFQRRICTGNRVKWLERLALQDIDWLGEVGYTEVSGQARMLALHRKIHLPRYISVTEMTGGTAAQFGDIYGFGEVHFEE